jgi:hypothetical protein
MTMKTVTSLLRRRGRKQGEDGKLQSLRLGHATAEGLPACHGGTWWAMPAGLLVARGLEGDCPVHHGLVCHHVHPHDQQGPQPQQGREMGIIIIQRSNAADLSIPHPRWVKRPSSSKESLLFHNFYSKKNSTMRKGFPTKKVGNPFLR